MTVTLIERYVRAVRDHLPRADQDDIIDELSDSLHSRFEDEAAAKGRPLLEEEEVAILRAYGHPMAVAARYRGDERSVTFGQRLIGPELFPPYMKVLAVNVSITLLIAAIALVAGSPMWSGVTGIIGPLAIQFTIVTAIFIVIDRRWIRNPEGWDPRTVTAMGPDVDISTIDGIADQLLGKAHTRAVSVTTSILEIGVIAVVLTVALNVGDLEQIGFMAPGPGWRDVFIPAIAILVAAFVTPVVNLVRPRWTRFRVASHLAVDIAVIVVGIVSLALGDWVVLAPGVTPIGEESSVIEGINTVVRISVAATVVLTAVTASLELRRLLRMPSPAAA